MKISVFTEIKDFDLWETIYLYLLVKALYIIANVI